MDSKRMQKIAVSLVLLAFVVLYGFRPELHSVVQDSHEYEETTITLKQPHNVKLMTPENNPALFTETFCNLQGSTQWYPGGDGWQDRTPYFLLAGAKKCGTTSLSQYLGAHPKLLLPPSKELRFFLPKNFEHVDDKGGKTLVGDARQYMYEHDYNEMIPQLQQDHSLLSFEATPGYVFQSTTSPKYILCAAPWVKILLILRNPVDRVWSNYNFYMTTLDFKLPSFEQWVAQDMTNLRRMGMLNKTADFAGSDQEYIAWDRYLNIAREGAVGRSMYAIQIQHWYEAMRAIGRDPTKDIFIVRNEDLKRDPQATLDHIFSWLGLPKQEVPAISQEFMVSKYEHRSMANETRKMLEEFYRPYNQRLYDLLGGDWQGVWEKPVDATTYESNNNVTKIYAGKNKNPKRGKQRPRGPWYNMNETLPVVKDPYVYGKASHNASAAAGFVNRWCDLKGVNWYPTTNDDAWQLRAPYILIPGAKKSGTTSLAFYLMQHPNVARARTKELQFFMNKNFRAKYVRDNDRKTLVKEARLAYEREFRKPRLQNDPSLISMDATPGYLFYSSMLPQRILCTAPWVKLLIILRNPVDRVYSNYQYVVWRTGMKASFEKFIDADIKMLRRSGVLVDDGEALTTEQEDEAWSNYLGVTREGPVGRSLYVIQLRQWFQAIRDVGRSPESHIHLVRTEDIKKDLDGEYRKIEDFLGLPHSPIKSVEEKVVNKYEPMKNETRALLEKLLDPYNKRLYAMLGGDWEGYWDP